MRRNGNRRHLRKKSTKHCARGRLGTVGRTKKIVTAAQRPRTTIPIVPNISPKSQKTQRATAAATTSLLGMPLGRRSNDQIWIPRRALGTRVHSRVRGSSGWPRGGLRVPGAARFPRLRSSRQVTRLESPEISNWMGERVETCDSVAISRLGMRLAWHCQLSGRFHANEPAMLSQISRSAALP